MVAERAGRPALAPGDRVLARIRPTGPGQYQGQTIERLSESPSRVLGVFRAGHPDGRIEPTDRRSKAEWKVPRGQTSGAESGELVLAEPMAHHGFGLKPARVIERLGKLGDAKSISLIAIHTHDIPVAFPDDALAEASHADSRITGASRGSARTSP